MKPKILVKAERGNFPEKIHYGFISVINEEFKYVLKIGDDNNIPFPFRSGAKPLQATAVIDTDTHKYFNFRGEELALFCASHAGTAEHIAKISQILEKTGLNLENLQCGSHMPLDADEQKKMIIEGKPPTPLHNNCSGKHAGMLSVCIKNNWDINTYLKPDHPVQKLIMQNIKDLCGLKNLPEIALDGCSAPVPILPHYNMGVGFLNLFSKPEYEPIKLAMAKNPFLSGGHGRLDSEIISASNGNIIAKVAAEGVCIVVNLEKKQVLVVKIIDADFKARAVVVIESVKKLGWLSEEQINSSERLKKMYDKQITNWKQEIVGEIKILF